MSGTPNDARRIVRTLRAGAVDAVAARAITVGTSSIEAKFSSLLDAFAAARKGGVLLVEGDWGAGKSHLSMLLRGEIEKRSLPWIRGLVDGRGGSLSHIHRNLSTWMEGIRFGQVRGLPDALGHGLLNADAAAAWASGESSPFARGLSLGLNGATSGWLLSLGHLYATPDSSYQHPKALALLQDCARFLTSVASAGLVLLLDEVENVAREHDIRGRRRCYETLGLLGQDANVFMVLFVTPLFGRQCSEDLRRAEGQWWTGWPGASRWFLTNMAGFQRVRIPPLTPMGAHELVGKIVDVHTAAYGNPSQDVDTDAVLHQWNSTITKSTRLLVRMVVQQLDLNLVEGERIRVRAARSA
jgi:hypothetical protein